MGRDAARSAARWARRRTATSTPSSRCSTAPPGTPTGCPARTCSAFVEYLADQQLPADTLAARAPDADAVALLTAHAARGREWRVVAVPGVQEGAWPDLRLRGSLLGNERLVDLVAGVAEPAAAVSRIAPLLAEERRLFYVACTRARETLLVSAVQADSTS